jgi:hypothetical protein
MKRVEGQSWRRLHNEELYNLYTLPNIIKEDEMDRTCSTHIREMRSTYKIMVRKTVGKRLIRRLARG